MPVNKKGKEFFREKKEKLNEKLPGIKDSIKSAAGSALETVSSVAGTAAETVSQKVKQNQAQESALPATNSNMRKQEYAGVLLKCPNCGAPIGQTTAVCPECGYHITGQAAVSSVQRFADQLMELEAKRRPVGLGQLMGVTASSVDKRKLALIQSFPIPNTIDDIQEFMLLSIANIDVGLSKRNVKNRWSGYAKSAETSITIPKTISDAWVSKMHQAYQKAKVLFPNESAFDSIKQIYMEKMKELKMKVVE